GGRVVWETAGLLTLRFDVSASVPPGRYWLHAFAGKVEAPLPVPLIVSDLEEKLSTPARRRAEPQPVRAPAAYNGVLDRRRDAHFFTMDVRAGERLVFDVDAMKLGGRRDGNHGPDAREGRGGAAGGCPG